MMLKALILKAHLPFLALPTLAIAFLSQRE
jgi:hypothetical protein